MDRIHHFPLDPAHGTASFWQRLAEVVDAWLQRQGLAARDAVLLLPFAQHLAPARRAWMAGPLSRWQPRIETTRSLASALGPSPLPQAQQISFDTAIDALAARQLLQDQSWALALQARDARGFELALQRLVEAAHVFAGASAQQAPGRREAFWTQAREALRQDGSGPGAVERALALVALEWAASDPRSPATDALFALRPSAWIQLRCGGPDALAESLLAEAEIQGLPCLRLDADLALDQAFAAGGAGARLEQAVCLDFEELAQCSAAAVLQHLIEGRAPVALIAQDRVLLRRVRALLERQGIGMTDETGWTLATTPVAAQLMALLRAGRREASVDEWLAWLKCGLAAGLVERHGGSQALTALEAQCRARGWSRPQAVRLRGGGAERLWQAAQQLLAPLQAGPASLADWLQRLADLLLQRLDGQALLEALPGGKELLDALWLRRQPWPGSAHEAVLQGARLSQAEFLAWVDATLEAAQYLPQPLGPVQVMITPLARAMLRPFGAIVLPGADAATLGPVPAGPALLGEAQLVRLGLPGLEDKRRALAWQFAQTLRAPALTLLRCASRGSEPLAASPLLERLALALRAGGQPPLAVWRDLRPALPLQPAASPRAAAPSAGRLPAHLTASSIESLRRCPYQFFSRVLLGLREQDELEGEADKRDYGSWLHAVLHEFHQQRLTAGDALPDAERLQRAADDQMLVMGLEPAEFLPFSASFARFAPRYLQWLAEQEGAGLAYLAGEQDRELRPWSDEARLAGITLRGRIDRIDAQGQARHLIDYKTGSLSGLRAKLADPLEDTQLAVYAALMGADAGQAGLGAAYLALDDAKGIAAVEHPEVARSAALLLQGLGQDLRALAEGAPLPALGEGQACAFCEMRGLCRRDDWEAAAL